MFTSSILVSTVLINVWGSRVGTVQYVTWSPDSKRKLRRFVLQGDLSREKGKGIFGEVRQNEGVENLYYEVMPLI